MKYEALVAALVRAGADSLTDTLDGYEARLNGFTFRWNVNDRTGHVTRLRWARPGSGWFRKCYGGIDGFLHPALRKSWDLPPWTLILQVGKGGLDGLDVRPLFPPDSAWRLCLRGAALRPVLGMARQVYDGSMGPGVFLDWLKDAGLVPQEPPRP